MDLRSNLKNSLSRVKKPTWKTIKFPSTIKLIAEPDQSIRYFNEAYKNYKAGNNVYFDLADVNFFSPESIAFFTACIADNRYTNKMNSRGNLPKSYILRKLFLESGFFDHVRLGDGIHPPKTGDTNKLLHNSTFNKVETDIAKEVCLLVKEQVGAEYIDDMEPLYVTLIEAMQNTNNHAGQELIGKYDWWLYRYTDKRKNEIHFTFLDLGVGVFNSLSVRNFRRKLMESARITSNLDLVDDLINGKIPSRTLRRDRGKGIPQIYDSSKDDMFKEFYILSNNILINAKTDERKLLREELHGTIYYWTIKFNPNGN